MTNRSRIGVVYCVLGILALLLAVFIFGFPVLKNTMSNLLISYVFWWCAGFPLVGIGAGLVFTRDHPPPSNTVLHYVFYYGFVWLVVLLAAYVAGFDVLSEAPNSKSLALSALVGLVGGFMGWRLNDYCGQFLKH